ncbi:MAG: hypothetical protein ACC682_04690, partial [Gemmatimonadota bacterium]
AVIGAAAGAIMEETFGGPYAVGVIATIGAIALLLFYGSAAIERVLAGWSFVLYGVYIALVVFSLNRWGSEISAAFAASPLEGSWLLNGVRYAGYNLSAGAVVLFTVRHIQTKKEAVSAGLLTGLIGILPAFFLYLAMVGHYPEITERAIPSNFLLEALGSRTFQVLFQIVLFGTLIETGSGMIHAVNERIVATRRERGVATPPWVRSVVAVLFLGVALSLTPLGLMNLIANGYGTITWGFIVLYVIPILTLGVWMLRRAGRGGSTPESETSGASETTETEDDT